MPCQWVAEISCMLGPGRDKTTTWSDYLVGHLDISEMHI
jgi:hypothetical protein